MGKIHPDVDYREPLLGKPYLRRILSAFLPHFDVTWGASRQLFGSEVSAFFLKPDLHMSEMFGLDREILLLHAGYLNLQDRTLQIADSILSVLPAKGRVEPLMFVLICPVDDIHEEVQKRLADNRQSKIPIPFTDTECVNMPSQFLVERRFQDYLFSRDLFDVTLPITSDLYFFGRNSLVIDLRDIIKNGENIGLFGLRKTGKSSVVLKLKRVLEEEELGTLIHLDLEDAALYQLRWWELLGEIRNRLIHLPLPQHDVDEKSAARLFRMAIEELGRTQPNKHIVVALDEIEDISPRLCMRPHWNEDFLDFWKTLRAVQNDNRHLNLLVAGVNASVIEVLPELP